MEKERKLYDWWTENIVRLSKSLGALSLSLSLCACAALDNFASLSVSLGISYYSAMDVCAASSNSRIVSESSWVENTEPDTVPECG